MLFVLLANATTFEKVEENRDCHAVACQAVEDFESDGELDEDSVEFIYNAVFESCSG